MRSSTAVAPRPTPTGGAMPNPTSAAMLEEFFATVIDGGDYTSIDRFVHPEFVDHSASGDLAGREAFEGMLDGFRAAMPGFRHDLSDVTPIGDDMALFQVHLIAAFT